MNSSTTSSSTYMGTHDNRRSLLSNFFDTMNPNRVPKDEFELYIESTVTFGKDETVLDYWRKHETVYPTISKIAKRILAIPATNTSVERLFSHSGNTVTSRRTRLGADKVNQLMFLRKNLRQLEKITGQDIVNVNNGKRKKDDSSISTQKQTQEDNKKNDNNDSSDESNTESEQEYNSEEYNSDE